MTVELILQGTSLNSNGSMSVQISDHIGVRYFNDSFEPGAVTISCCIEWPTCVTIELGNKNPADTVFDSNGNVVANKGVEIDAMLINRFPVQYELMESQFNCTHQGSDAVTHENFWGFNGQVRIVFDQPSPMQYMLALKNPFEMKRLSWVDE
jgi:hypothetical protein